MVGITMQNSLLKKQPSLERGSLAQNSEILPEGDRCDLPPGRRQYRLSSLFVLLALGAVVAAVCRSCGFGVTYLAVFYVALVIFWWQYAELRADYDSRPSPDQSELREEVKRWLQDRERNKPRDGG